MKALSQPLFASLRGYDRAQLGPDLFSGVLIALLSIPISMGYAQLAGLPPVVIKRAEQVLDALEHDKKNQKINDLADDLPLFASVQKKVAEEEVERFSPVEEALEAVNPDELTPREALEELYEIKALL